MGFPKGVGWLWRSEIAGCSPRQESCAPRKELWATAPEALPAWPGASSRGISCSAKDLGARESPGDGLGVRERGAVGVEGEN